MSDQFIPVTVGLVIFLGYCITQMILTIQEEKKNIEAEPKNIPMMYRLGYAPIMLISEIIGKDLARLFPKRTNELHRLLVTADLSAEITPAFIFSAQIFYAFLGGVIGFCLISPIPLIPVPIKVIAILVLAVFSWMYPKVIVDKVIDERKIALIKALPYSIDLIASAMRSGLDFGAAMLYYVNLKIPGPLTREFHRVSDESRVGKTRAQALTAMAERIQIPEFTTFIGAVVHGLEVGASITETLKIQGEELRRARYNIAEMKAARAPSIMLFPMALFILPAVFLCIATPVWLRIKDSGALAMFGK